MAHDDKTEKPTPKKRKEARQRGQVAKSPDVSGWLILLAGSVVVPMLFRAGQSKLTGLFNQSTNVMASPSPQGALAIMEKGLADMVELVLPVVAVFAVVGVVANVAQTGLVLSPKALKLNWKKINPVSGVKNLFSVGTVWTLAKQILKLVVLVFIAYGTVSHLAKSMVGSSPAAMGPVADHTGSVLIGLIREVAGAGLVLAAADYAWQRHQLQKQLKMTKQEVKDENKQQEGDRFIKGAIRKKQYTMSRSRMMAAVMGADVIVVNPTHFAVALKYDTSKGTMAPIVVAKGVDELAMRIREEGMKHKVPVVEDPPLARAVYAACELEQPIPAELFLAVARVLAFVFTLNPVVRNAGIVHRRPSSAMVA